MLESWYLKVHKLHAHSDQLQDNFAAYSEELERFQQNMMNYDRRLYENRRNTKNIIIELCLIMLLHL